jgi:hypothetical protein
MVLGISDPYRNAGSLHLDRALGASLLLVYPLQVLRLFLLGNRSPRENFWRAAFLVLGKFPEMLGQAKFMWDRTFGNRARLIEYK